MRLVRRTPIQTGYTYNRANPGGRSVLLFDRDYWERVIDFRTLVEEGVIGEKDLDLITHVQSADEAWNVIREHYAYTGLLPTPNDC